MKVTVQFFSYLKELAGMSERGFEVREGATIAELMEALYQDLPQLEQMHKSTLIAVGLEYQGRDYLLQEGDRVSLFPPVQGG